MFVRVNVMDVVLPLGHGRNLLCNFVVVLKLKKVHEPLACPSTLALSSALSLAVVPSLTL